MNLKTVSGQMMFPTPVWRAEYEGYEATNRAILAQMDAIDWAASHARRGLDKVAERRHGEDVFITPDEVPSALEIVTAFASNCVQIARELGWDLDRNEFRVTSMWAHVTPPGKNTQLHHHLPSHLSCVYYVATPPGCGNLRFLDDRKHRALEPHSLTDHEVLRRVVEIAPAEGLMVIFPSSVEHQVAENGSGERRVSISLNADFVPREQGAYPHGVRVDSTGALRI